MAKINQSPIPALPESAGIIDAHAGSQLRAARQALGWSQSKLGETVGVSFQQVQKYEKAINRIAFSTLQKFAAALNLPIEHFLHDAPNNSSSFAAPPRADYIASKEPDAVELMRLYDSLKDDEARKKLLALARSLSDNPKKPKKS